ncbi:M1 family metallopeptidase [Nocardioides sp. LML1-1-1.1]|uniref:M1 family metallopeptidase n=1 Tax=Nocardioides sp. LML1-1-1.1 TaxID=3135248 RepID=UPI00343E66C8
MRWRIVLVVLLLVLVPGFSGAAVRTAAPSGGGGSGPDPYWKLDGNGGTNALRYDVRVGYDFSRARLSGRTIVTMRATKDLYSLNLDLLLPVSGVTVDGRKARFGKPNNHELYIRPARAIRKGAIFKVAVAYGGYPGRYRYAGERNWLADSGEVVAMNEPHMAPWWFPSNDHPSDKAVFDIRVTTPRGKRVVSNGSYVGRTVRGTKATTHWRMSDPMATYLAFFAAGRFQVETGRSAAGIRYVNAVSARLPKAERTRAMAALRRTGAITDWLQSWVGKYPFTSTGGLVTSLGVGFALENQTRPTYGSWVYPGVIVHEIAHQWFGDSVSVQRWRDIWINEGFATFSEVAYDAAHGGPSVKTWLDRAWDEECGERGSFWAINLSNPGAANIFDSAVYDRGAMVLAALQSRIGATAMRDLLRTWVASHHDGNATVAQFEALASARTGQDLRGFFQAWLRSGAAPAATPANGLTHACP